MRNNVHASVRQLPLRISVAQFVSATESSPHGPWSVNGIVLNEVVLVGKVAAVRTLQDKSIYFVYDNSGPFIQIWRLHHERISIADDMLTGARIRVTGFIRRAGDIYYVQARNVTVVRDYQEDARLLDSLSEE